MFAEQAIVYYNRDYEITLTDQEEAEVSEHITGMAGHFDWIARTRYAEDEYDQAVGWAKRDATVGKRGEIIAARLINQVGGGRWLAEPDFKIYPSHMKTFSCDLLDFVHVKTSWRSYGGEWSWTFQRKSHAGPGGTDDIFKRDDLSREWGLFVAMYGEDSLTGRVMLEARMDIVRANLEPPIKKNKVGMKECVYLSTMKELI